MNILICITHCQRWDPKDELDRTLSRLVAYKSNLAIIDDSGADFTDPTYYDSYRDKVRFIHCNEANMNSFLARKQGALLAKQHGFEYIQYVDTGDTLEINNHYQELYNRIDSEGFDMGIYPQVCHSSALDPRDIYYSRIGTTKNQRLIQRSLLERSLSCSQCMKIYRTDLVLKAYDHPELLDLHIFDLDDYVFNMMYALECKSLTCSTYPHYTYYIDDGASNKPVDPSIIEQKYQRTVAFLPQLIKKYYQDKFPESLLDYYIQERLDSYFKRQTNGYNKTW